MLKEEDSPLSAKKNDSVMKVKTYHTPTQSGATGGKAKQCFICKQDGHISGACPQKQKKGNPRWCDKCQVIIHYTERCWSKNGKKSKKKDSVKTVSVNDPTSDNEDSARMVRIIKQPSDDEPERDVYFMAVDSTQKVFGAMEEDKENDEEMKLEGSGSEQNCKRPRDEPLEELTDSTLTKINSLLVDTGATSHIIKDLSKFVSFDKEYDPSGHIIELADGTRTTGWVKGRGVALFRLNDTKGVPYNVRLTNALYIPGYNQNILSVRKATKTGASFCFSETEAKLQLPDGNVFDIEQKGKLYYLNHVRIKKKGRHTLTSWHKRLGHCNYRDLKDLQKVVEGMHITDYTISEEVCGICVKGKQAQFKNKKPDRRAETKFELVHSDLTGKIKNANIENVNYAITFVDDYSGMINVYLLKAKSDTVEATEKYLTDISPYGEVRRLRTDNGGEYTSAKFEALMVKHRIKHEFSAPHSPHQNGTAERSWRTIFETARCLLFEADVPKYLWPYAVKAAAYILNRRLNRRIGITASEAATGIKPNLQNLEIFGSVCYAYVQEKAKLDARCEEGIFIGYDSKSPANLVYFPEKRCTKRVREVEFTTRYRQIGELEKRAQTQTYYEELEPIINQLNQPESTIQGESTSEDQPASVSEPNQVSNDVGPRYPKRDRQPSKKYDKNVFVCNIVTDCEAAEAQVDDEEPEDEDVAKTMIDYCYRVSEVPNTYQQAISCKDSQGWQNAMQQEMESLEENGTYSLVPLPNGRKAIGSRWVYTVKLGIDGEEQLKARCVAKGFSQIADIDYHETFSPTARQTSIRMFMQLAIDQSMVVHQMDFNCAYLNADIDAEIYMRQPPGFNKDPGLVCKLKKSLYGLKQSGRL